MHLARGLRLPAEETVDERGLPHARRAQDRHRPAASQEDGEAIETAVSFSTAIVDQASGLLESIGVGRPGAVLASLVRSAIENSLARHDSGPMFDGVDGGGAGHHRAIERW